MQKYGLIGKKLGHSFSRNYFNDKFHREHIEAVYLNFELAEIDEIGLVLADHPELHGFNVTIPYKQRILPYLNHVDEVAHGVGAVNTVQVEHDGSLSGYNTDVIGFRDSLSNFYQGDPGGKALILGSGGASKAVRYALRHFFEFEEVEVASRNPRMGYVAYATLHERGLQDYRLIVNCTPLGMAPYPETFPDLPYASLAPGTFLHDLVYNPEHTEFLNKGRAHGGQVKNGMEMLIGQAEAAWSIWRDTWAN
ncbi:MAG: shikimate dehydrogenase [Bacteroidota bacterium]